MEKNIEILEFLDGSLSPEAEAELLHRLSVSPERREVLRSHIDQRVLFQRDREAINVPYAAEQKLWSRLAEVMPVAPVASTMAPATTAVVSASRGFRLFSVASIGAVCVIIGLLSGLYLGSNNGNEIVASSPVEQTILAIEQPPVQQAAPATAHNTTNRSIITRQRSEAPLASLPVLVDRATPVEAAPVVASETEASPAVAAVRAELPASNVFEPRESHSLAALVTATQQSEQSVYPMELSFAESFGMQFPADAASRNTQPLITNSTISGMYQIYHGQIELWVGANIGSANIARKTLREDPQPGGGSELVADVSHLQTTWVGPTVQARYRFTQHISSAVSGGVSYSDLGSLFHAEVNGRYDLTDQVGITLGLRSLHLPYDLSQEQIDVIRTAVYDIDAGGPNYGNEWSHNFEILTGMYFRF